MNGIFYFSSTGNSLFIAKALQAALGGQVCYIPRYQGNGGEYDQLFLVSPVYSFGLPIPVYDLIPRLSSEVPLTIVLNYGGMVSGADVFTYAYARECGKAIRAVHTVKMPENFTLTFTVPKPYLQHTLRTAPRRVERLIEALRRNEEAVPKGKASRKEEYLKNKSLWHTLSEDFQVTNACIQCGKCVKLCPAENISLRDGKISFANRCIACLGCYHRCPQKAIVYKKKRKKFRYCNPNVRESDIGKDF